MPHLLRALVLALIAAPANADNVVFPSDLLTDQEKIDWLKAEAQKNEAAVALEMGKPATSETRGKLEAIRSRQIALGDLAATHPGGLYLPWSGAAPALSRLEQTEASAAAEKKRLADAEATEKKRLAAIRLGGYPDDDRRRIVERKVWVGMSKEQALLSWGAPVRRHEPTTASGKTEV